MDTHSHTPLFRKIIGKRFLINYRESIVALLASTVGLGLRNSLSPLSCHVVVPW